MVIHPIRTQTELASSFRDAGSKSLLCIGETERVILRYKGAVDVVDVLGALVVGEQGVEDHDGTTMYDKADLLLEGVVQPLREIRERLLEQLAHQQDVVYIFQSWNDGSRWVYLCYQCHPRH